MDLGIKGKVAWVIGGSSGLGRASAERLAMEGCNVAVSARDEGPLSEAATAIEATSGSRCIPVPLDVTDGPAIKRAAGEVASSLGPIDILVANAGGPPPGSFESMDEDDLVRAFELNTLSAWRFTESVLPSMKERRTGAILFVTSSSTKELIPGLLLSNTVRAAVVGFAKTLSKELGPHGIRVICVAPGTIDTPRIQQLERAASDETGRPVDDIRKEAESRIPLGRIGDPGEFGDVVAFLASERASYISGITVLVDGGRSVGILS